MAECEGSHHCPCLWHESAKFHHMCGQYLHALYVALVSADVHICIKYLSISELLMCV